MKIKHNNVLIIVVMYKIIYLLMVNNVFQNVKQHIIR